MPGPLPLYGVEDAGEKTKTREVQSPGSFLQSGDGSNLGRSFRHRFLDRLVGIARARRLETATAKPALKRPAH